MYPAFTRRLLFTDNSVLSHPLGGGQEAFGWHKRQKKTGPVQVGRHEDESKETGDGWMNVVDSETGDVVSAISALPDIPDVGSGPIKPHGEVISAQTEKADIALFSNQLSPVAASACSSYFIEPVEWMEPMIIGCLQGKVGVAAGQGGCGCA